MRCSNEDIDYHGNFYFLKKLLKNYHDANLCTHQTDAIQHDTIRRDDFKYPSDA